MARAKKEGSFINCKVKQDLYERMSVYSEKSGVPKTTLVEMALTDYLDKVDTKKVK